MDTPTVPAWKKLGLRVKETIENDPLRMKKTDSSLKSKLKRAHGIETKSGNNSSNTRPPKKPKLPKSERKPPPEADQLLYLRLYSQDKASWKFSKSKQNWILRHTYDTVAIPETYAEYLIAYLQGIQGGAKVRIIENAEKIIEEWNNFMLNGDDSKANEECEEETKNYDTKKEEGAIVDPKLNSDPNDNTETKELMIPPTEINAILAQRIVHKLCGKHLDLNFIESRINIEDK